LTSKIVMSTNAVSDLVGSFISVAYIYVCVCKGWEGERKRGNGKENGRRRESRRRSHERQLNCHV